MTGGRGPRSRVFIASKVRAILALVCAIFWINGRSGQSRQSILRALALAKLRQNQVVKMLGGDGWGKKEVQCLPEIRPIDDPQLRIYTKESYETQRRQLRHGQVGVPFVFDKLFSGHGIPFGEITEIAGISCTGKTSIAMQATINCLTSSPEYRVIYIGTVGSLTLH